ncbi:1,4-dihydroxy-2-naphthoate octaprenyltransferase [Oryzomicrobium terrae]|uniref:1,4-dihydroxy-2-naphthoate octaprenyltransferase n=1 Tax=Oryzomicrobium terrae TaxID=1735038 RepID=A0A5C1E6F1_9RHOO|nr:1,4-dihydroxy-2-naphthoate octaprenyltransferase [Oryzomicrobium terrae]QEL64149.1 1,4-dihydroxy-2-naphthoate octaprenyltransferase [Oryzomicrobium terrae]
MSVTAPPAAASRLHPLARWWATLRPRTLTVSLSPVLLGVALAWAVTGSWRPLPALACLLGALLIQIGTNLHNDAGDFLRGADTSARLGPPRACAQGWLTARQVRNAAWGAFALAFLVGIYLVAVGGWPIVALGLASLVAGWAYTDGPRPIAYSPTGEVFVWLFFGLAAVGGTVYLQLDHIPAAAWLAAHLLGTLAAAVITVNNLRDEAEDRRSGKRTLVVAGGRRLGLAVLGALMLTPFALLPLMMPLTGQPSLWLLLPWLQFPQALRLLGEIRRTPPGPVYNRLLGATARLQLGFAVTLAAGLLLARLIAH